MERITIIHPITYKTVTIPDVIEPARIEYDLILPDPKEGGTGSAPIHVKERHIEAIVVHRNHRVREPLRYEERLMPVVYRDGFRRIVRTPTAPKSILSPIKQKLLRLDGN